MDGSVIVAFCHKDAIITTAPMDGYLAPNNHPTESGYYVWSAVFLFIEKTGRPGIEDHFLNVHLIWRKYCLEN